MMSTLAVLTIFAFFGPFGSSMTTGNTAGGQSATNTVEQPANPLLVSLLLQATRNQATSTSNQQITGTKNTQQGTTNMQNTQQGTTNVQNPQQQGTMNTQPDPYTGQQPTTNNQLSDYQAMMLNYYLSLYMQMMRSMAGFYGRQTIQNAPRLPVRSGYYGGQTIQNDPRLPGRSGYVLSGDGRDANVATPYGPISIDGNDVEW